MTTALLAAVAALVLLAGLAGVAGRPGLAIALAAHDVLTRRAQRVLAALVPALEVLLGAAGLVVAGAWFAGARPPGGRMAAAALLVLSAAYAAYTLVAWRRARASGRVVPCGCGVAEGRLTGWHPARAALMALAAAAAMAWPGAPAPQGSGQHVIVLAASMALAALLAVLPAARAMPGPGRAGRSRRQPGWGARA